MSRRFTLVDNGYDSDAQAFLTATGISNLTISVAINTLVVSLKSNGLWTKCNALYPFVGGTASTHKFNLKDPRDLDVAFRIVFSGGWTHSSNGALPNGTNAFGDTKFNPVSQSVSLTSHSLSYYSSTAISVTGTSRGYIGCFEGDSGVQSISALGFFNSGTLETSSLAGLRNGSGYTPSASNPSFAGMRFASVNGSRVNRYFKNGVKNAETVTQTGNYPNFIYYLGAINNNNLAQFFMNTECRFAHIGTGFTDTDASNFYTIVQQFQTALSRNV